MENAQHEQLRERLGQLWDVVKLGSLAAWDQQTMMPPQGAGVRARQLATASKLVHDLLVSDDLGRLLDELRPYEESLDPDSNEASLIRVTRLDREKELRVPGELREEQARASAEAYPVWVEARRTSSFELFRPYLDRNIELRRRYAECFEVDEPYDALLDDFERGMKTAEVRSVFERLKEGLVPRIAEASAQEIDDSFLRGHFPVPAQEELERLVLERYGFREGSWRVDPTEHPFASSLGTSDIRMTTRHPENELSGIFAAMHEGGHALYEHNVDPALERTPLCRGVSLALHESQSRMFENLVGRSLAFWCWAYPHAQRLFPQLAAVGLEEFHRAINRVKPSLIRIEADEATYSLHIILRFELEQELIAGSFDLRELPRVWNERMGEYLGVEVPDDAHGVLQDVHWSRANYFGYFPTYALGNVVSVQIWERVLDDVPDLDDRLSQGDLAPLCDWLRDRLWRHGRKFTPRETLERVVGGGLDPEPYLRYLNGKLGALAT